MARIYKRGKVWYLDIQANGTRIRRRIGTRKKVAELALQDAVVKNERQEFGFARKDATVQKFIEQFLEYSKANHRPSTVRRYTAVCDHFLEFIKAKRNDIGFISLVTPEVMDQYKVFRKEEWTNPNGAEVNGEEDVREYTRKGARAHTINFEISALRTVFNLAIKWGYLRDNPTKEIKKLKVDDAKPVRFLTKKECQRLLEASPEHLYPIFYTFLHTGMRKQELENLEWSDIDLRRNRIQIKRKANWNPKTGERDIPISQPLHDLLKGLKDRRGDESYVFPDKNGGKSRMKLREQLIRVARKAEIDDLTKLHTLRHTFASHLVMSGVDLPTVQKLMGHADIQTTMIYAHLAPDHLAEAVGKLRY